MDPTQTVRFNKALTDLKNYVQYTPTANGLFTILMEYYNGVTPDTLNKITDYMLNGKKGDTVERSQNDDIHQYNEIGNLAFCFRELMLQRPVNPSPSKRTKVVEE